MFRSLQKYSVTWLTIIRTQTFSVQVLPQIGHLFCLIMGPARPLDQSHKKKLPKRAIPPILIYKKMLFSLTDLQKCISPLMMFDREMATFTSYFALSPSLLSPRKVFPPTIIWLAEGFSLLSTVSVRKKTCCLRWEIYQGVSAYCCGWSDSMTKKRYFATCIRGQMIFCLLLCRLSI